MNARIVTTPCHPALFAFRGYTGSISPRGRGARVVGAAAPCGASADPPGSLAGPPKPEAAALVPKPSGADVFTGLTAAEVPAPPAAAGSGGASSAAGPAAAGISFCGAGEAGGTAGSAGGADGEAAHGADEETGPAASPLAATDCAASGPAPVKESKLTSMAGGPGSLCPVTRGTKSMTACRPRATRTERANACRGFTSAPLAASPTASSSCRSGWRMEASGSPDRTGTPRYCRRRRCSRGRSGYSWPRE
jgi:regulator of sigma E protease